MIDDVLVHKIVPALSFPSGTLNLPVSLQNDNSGGGTANVSLTAGVAFVSRTGPLQTDSRYAHIDSAATTVLKIGAGRLHRIVVNDPAGTITVYDNIIAAAPVIAVMSGGTAVVSVEYGLPFNTGLTVVTSNGAVDLTVIYE